MKNLKLEMVRVFGKNIRKNITNIREFNGYTSIVKLIIEKLKSIDFTLSNCNGTDFSIYSNKSYKNFVWVGDKKINLYKLRTTDLRVIDLGAIVDMIDNSLFVFDSDEISKMASKKDASMNLTNYIRNISYTEKNYSSIRNFNAGRYNYILLDWIQDYKATESNLKGLKKWKI